MEKLALTLRFAARQLTLILAVAMMLAVGAHPAAAVVPAVNSCESTQILGPNTRVRDILLQRVVVENPNRQQSAQYTYVVNVDPESRTALGMNRRRGRGRLTVGCNNSQGTSTLATRNRRFDRNGNFAVTGNVPANRCDFLLLQFEGASGNQIVPAGTGIAQHVVLETRSKTTPSICSDGNTLCLGGGRFQANVSWQDSAGRTGDGLVVPGGPDSGHFYFFDPDNTEMLVKVIDGCDFNSHYWVFAAAATDVEYTLTVTDSSTGSSRTYDNDLGTPAQAITDTQAFATCP